MYCFPAVTARPARNWVLGAVTQRGMLGVGGGQLCILLPTDCRWRRFWCGVWGCGVRDCDVLKDYIEVVRIIALQTMTP
ncbi:hypothetical protein BaRGS_00023478 [Batillaria attramentaria]|uniref:Uncharacterized protein n=1 Tax=Batillaria attramentaria TaxID=370345 RepID=A0ABD0KE80_9CAEN